jgi:hypothetical protein
MAQGGDESDGLQLPYGTFWTSGRPAVLARVIVVNEDKPLRIKPWLLFSGPHVAAPTPAGPARRPKTFLRNSDAGGRLYGLCGAVGRMARNQFCCGDV